MTGGDVLEQALAIFRQREKVYGGNKKRVGNIMAALFPDGVTLRTANDMERYQHLELAIVKLSRYVNNWDQGGHADSSLDAANYLAILTAIDANIAEEKVK